MVIHTSFVYSQSVLSHSCKVRTQRTSNHMRTRASTGRRSTSKPYRSPRDKSMQEQATAAGTTPASGGLCTALSERL
jgi:hypothetical protein